jgi:hypothetical protein
MSKDRWKHRTDHVSDPARNFQNVAPDDANDLALEPKGVIFGTTGNAILVGEDGVTATVPVIAGVTYPFMPQRIKSTGHTAGTVTLLY